MNFLKVIISLFLSQLLVVGVFWLSKNSYYVVNVEKNLCWEFTKWSNIHPNWLPNNWEAVFLFPEIENSFLEDISCLESNVAKCCVSQWYRFAWIPIWVEYISDERKGAELLAAKNIIETKSFNPNDYNLDKSISRKEIMKIIMNISKIEVQDNCREIFIDVNNDWGCKYIESALENNFITTNQAFRPDDYVTQTEALKLIFKARWIEKSYNTSFWQEDYISTAYYKWFIDKKYSNYNEIATRGWIFSVTGKTFEEFKNY